MIVHLETRFSDKLEEALIGTYLLPSYLPKLTSEVITRMKNEFETILLYPSQFFAEVNTWKAHVEGLEMTDCEKNSLLYISNLVVQHLTYYPNISSILSLLLTLPVGSCSCKRSFSSLQHLKTWCRSMISNDKLNSLAIGYINRDYCPSPEELLKA